MALLSLEAFAEMRVISAQLREASQTAQARSHALHDLHARVLAQRLASRERLAPFLPPTFDEIRQAESQLLERFRAAPPRDGPSEGASGEACRPQTFPLVLGKTTAGTRLTLAGHTA
jgi:hypothetical protein